MRSTRRWSTPDWCEARRSGAGGLERAASDLRIDAFTQADLPAALAIQRQVYPSSLIEDEAAFASRLDATPTYSLVARQDGELLGYLLAHGWKRGSPPSLGPLPERERASEVLFLHDLAVSPQRRGLDTGQRLIARAFATARADGLHDAELIAVAGAAEYWRRLGFEEGVLPAGMHRKLDSYGPDASWMTRSFG